MSEFKFKLAKNGKFFKLLESFEYRERTIPENFITNFASIPRVFKLFIAPYGKYDRPAILHDFHYNCPDFHITRAKADKIFLENMLYENVSKKYAYPFYWAVRVFGKKRR